MMTTPTRTAWALTLAGVIPFLGLGSIIAVMQPSQPAYLAQGTLVAYAAVIVSFLGGTRWGLEMAGARPSTVVLILSNIFPLVAWGLVAAPGIGSAWTLCGLGATLFAQLIWDWPASSSGYRQLRVVATIGALVGLTLALLSQA